MISNYHHLSNDRNLGDRPIPFIRLSSLPISHSGKVNRCPKPKFPNSSTMKFLMLSLFPISKYLDFSTLRRINFKEIGQILPILTIIIIRANRTNHFSSKHFSTESRGFLQIWGKFCLVDIELNREN